jgi:hypothetical protein
MKKAHHSSANLSNILKTSSPGRVSECVGLRLSPNPQLKSPLKWMNKRRWFTLTIKLEYKPRFVLQRLILMD